jgi:WD40 repeat protein
VYATSFTADGRQLVSAGADCTLRVWDLQTLENVRVLRGHAEEVWAITRLPGEDSFLSGGRDGTILQWDLKSINKTITDRAHQSTDGLAQVSITPPQITRDEKHIVAIGKDNSILIMDAADLRRVTRLSSFPSHVLDVWVLPELNVLAISDASGQIGLYKMDGSPLQKVPAHPGPCLLWAFRDNQRLATYEQGGGSVKIWSIPELTQLAEWTLRHPEDRPGASALIDDLAESSSTFATYDTAGRICLWDKRTGTFIRNIATSKHFVNSMEFSPTDEHLLACVSNFGQIRLFDVREPRELSQWKAHRGQTRGTAFFPDGQRILTSSSSHDTFVTIWDATSERHLATLGGTATTRWHRITVSPRSEMIVLVDQGGPFMEGRMNVWRAPSWQEIATAERLAASSRPLLSVKQPGPSP